FIVSLLLLLLRVVVAVHQRGVVVLVGVPVRAVLPLVQGIAAVVMRHVIVVVSMGRRTVGVLRFIALTLGALADGRGSTGLHLSLLPPVTTDVVANRVPWPARARVVHTPLR